MRTKGPAIRVGADGGIQNNLEVKIDTVLGEELGTTTGCRSRGTARSATQARTSPGQRRPCARRRGTPAGLPR